MCWVGGTIRGIIASPGLPSTVGDSRSHAKVAIKRVGPANTVGAADANTALVGVLRLAGLAIGLSAVCLGCATEPTTVLLLVDA